MGLLTKAFALLALVCFGLASEHCRLELLAGSALLQCACAGESGQCQGTGCSDELCSGLESGGYRSEEQTPLCPAPCLATVALLPEPLSLPGPLFPALYESDAAPPELPRSWQFSQRAAPAPRAPSALS